jgi:hypothetical protein
MKKFNTLLCAVLIGAFGFLMGTQQASAQASLSVQGSLQNFNGSAVDNGQYDITFKIYTTDAGGTPIWTEMQTVPVTNGVYSVHLGDVNPLNIPFDQTYYLGLTLPGGPEHTPRARLTSSPYALSLLGQDNKFPSTGMVKMEAIATGQATTTATSYAVTADDHVIFLDHTANQNVTLPAATAANAGRHLMLVNKVAVAKTLTSSSYVDLAGATSTTVPATGVVELQSDGSVWRQTGGYVQPASVGKAFVRLNKAVQTAAQNSTPPNLVVLSYTEISDAQNCWNSTTNTFTAPRTGVYQISGAIRYASVGGAYPYIGLNDFWPSSNTATALIQIDNPTVNSVTYPFSIAQPMTAGETFQLKVMTANGAVTLSGHPHHFLTIMEY